MTTPAGWYDDGSGRQRWWDGTQWTEHFAPVAEPEAPAAETPSVETAESNPFAPAEERVIEAAPSVPSEDAAPVAASEVPEVPPVPENLSYGEQPATDAWAPAQEQPTIPFDAPAEQPTQQFEAPGAGEQTPPVTGGLPPYAAPAPGYAPSAGYPEAAPTYAGVPQAPAYPAAAPGSQSGAPGYAAAGAAPYGTAPSAPASISILGLVGLGLAVLGVILSCIPVTPVMVIGWVVLLAGLVISVVSLFLKGRKWPGITGLIVGVIGIVIAFIVAIVFFAAMAINSAIDDLPSSPPSSSAEDTPSDEPTDSAEDPDAALGRPTVDELKVGLRAVIEESTGSSDSYTDAQVTCFAQAFVDSDVDDATLRKIAEGTGVFDDVNAASAFAEVFADNISTCMLAQ
ncbi:MAG: DUF2510 domain-containing protein [Microbacterium sp.]|uniref:DUF2510 domain-containing protein n=1 Tax=Microbacterium sp. TaxID=51671 RepID=UPI001D667E05|nr:DUF2510 domain-containing protein [Microbacterium sp.]MBW8763620.1 DUF2510 domain-containing protein [Microbacterium sp.]